MSVDAWDQSSFVATADASVDSAPVLDEADAIDWGAPAEVVDVPEAPQPDTGDPEEWLAEPAAAGVVPEVVDTVDAPPDAASVFADSMQETPVGASFLPEKDQPAAFDVPAYDGEYVLDVHGSPESVGVNGADMNASEFAAVVKDNTSWNGTDPIRLFSCDTGATENGFAQQLADEVGVDVTAPTAPVWSMSDGSEPVVSAAEFDPVTGLSYPVDPPTGEWKTFKPR